MRRDDPPRRAPAFTLVELLLVMALLTIIMALVSPALSRSLRGHKLDDEAARFVALSEYARDEAISEGLPMVVWINGSTQKFGLDPQNDYYNSPTHQEFNLNPDVTFESMNLPANTTVITFGADGALDLSSVASFRLKDRYGKSALINRRADNMGYEIVKDAP